MPLPADLKRLGEREPLVSAEMAGAIAAVLLALCIFLDYLGVIP